jgi:hypothetical protein
MYSASAERLCKGSIPCYTLPYEESACARVCVCVCVWQRERERGGNAVFQQHPLKICPSPPRHVAHSTARWLITCVMCNRKKENYSKRHSWGHTGSLQHYPLEMTQCWRILLMANLFSYWGSTCSQGCCTMCGWVTASWHFEGTYHLHFLHSLITLKMKVVCVLRLLGRIYPTTLCNSPEHLVQ